MATVTFSSAMPQGRRIADFFSPLTAGTLDVTDVDTVSFAIAHDGAPLAMAYFGRGLTTGTSNVSMVVIGPSDAPWLTFGAADEVTRFSYGNLESFQASGAAAAGTMMAGDDLLVGSTHGDYLDGYGGNDTLDGGGGADTMEGGAGDDLYLVDDVSDRVIERTGQGYDTVITSVSFALAGDADVEELRAAGNAVSLALTGSNTSNRIYATAGNDTLDGAGGNDTLTGGAGDDTYIVNSPADVLVEDAWAGYDTVLTHTDYALAAHLEVLKATAGSGAVWLTGNELDNDIMGNTGADILQGLGGNDRLYGDGGDDQLCGADGIDQLFGGIGNDALHGGTGDDALYADVGDDYLRGDDGSDQLYGGPGDDTLYGDGGNDALYGDVGNDRFFGGAGDDALFGGLGRNVLYGGDGKDVLYGGMHSETLSGDAGNDKLYGDSGNDVLNGGLGNDSLAGGNGSDTFVFNTRLHKSTNVDRIVDFSVKADRIKLDDAIFKKIGSRGTLKADAFHIGSSAQDAEDRVIYRPGNGTLYYDADGTGPASPVRFAILKKGLALKANDFFII